LHFLTSAIFWDRRNAFSKVKKCVVQIFYAVTSFPF